MFKESLLLFATDFKNSSKDLMPSIVVVIFFQIAFIKTVPENLVPTSLGLLTVALFIGCAITLGALCILWSHPIYCCIITWYFGVKVV